LVALEPRIRQLEEHQTVLTNHPKNQRRDSLVAAGEEEEEENLTKPGRRVQIWDTVVYQFDIFTRISTGLNQNCASRTTHI